MRAFVVSRARSGSRLEIDADFVVFGVVASETDHLPTGTARQYWNPAALAEADAHIVRIEENARDDVDQACNGIIARFSDDQESQMANAKHIPAGWPALIPRIFVDDPEGLVGFIQHVFGAVGRFHPERPSELRIGDSMLMVSSAVERPALTAFLYVYVDDADAVFQCALDRGAASLEEPQDMPYGDRRAMVLDPWGNTWQIATHRGRFT